MNRTLDQLNGFHGGVQVVGVRFVYVPDIALVAGAAPVMSTAFAPAVQYGLELALVVRTAERERILTPYQEGGPVPSCIGEGFVQSMEFGGRHADVDRSLRYGEDVDTHTVQKCFEILTQIVIGHGTLGSVALLLAEVFYVIYRVSENQIGLRHCQHFVERVIHRAIATQQEISSEQLSGLAQQ